MMHLFAHICESWYHLNDTQQIIIANKNYVAERFFFLESDVDVTPSRNANGLKAELGRVALLKWFFDSFKDIVNP
jgi:hypothetical protein